MGGVAAGVLTAVALPTGVAKMRYRTFVSFNVIGALLWGVGVTVLGYFLGQFECVKTNIEAILILIVGLSLVPVALELLRARSNRRDTRYDEPQERARVAHEDIPREGTE